MHSGTEVSGLLRVRHRLGRGGRRGGGQAQPQHLSSTVRPKPHHKPELWSKRLPAGTYQNNSNSHNRCRQLACLAPSNITAITTSTTINRSRLALALPARSLLPPAPPCCLPCERRRCWPKPWGSCLQPWTGTAQPSAARHQAAPPVSPAPESWRSQRWLQLQVQQSPHSQLLLMAPQMGQAHAVTPKGRGVRCNTQRTRHFVTSAAQVRRPHSAHTLRARHCKP
jgi:hypothetical protein